MAASAVNRAYGDTNVAAEKSQAEMRKMLRRHGADRSSFSESTTHAEVTFVFGGYAVRMRVPIVPLTKAEGLEYARERRVAQAKLETDEQRFEIESRRVWRVLYWLLKTRMEAIEAGVETFAEAFLAHLVDPSTDRTVYESLADAGGLRQLESGGGS